MKLVLILGVAMLLLTLALPAASADSECLVGGRGCWCASLARSCKDTDTGYDCTAAVAAQSSYWIGVHCTAN